jgi:hypothetical protein
MADQSEECGTGTRLVWIKIASDGGAVLNAAMKVSDTVKCGEINEEMKTG